MLLVLCEPKNLQNALKVKRPVFKAGTIVEYSTIDPGFAKFQTQSNDSCDS